MHRCRLTLATVLTALLLLCASKGFAQSSMMHTGGSGSAHGNLTVAATVVSSVGLVIGPDGELRLFVANAADPSDNVSSLQPVRTVALTANTDPSLIADAQQKKKKR
jgi:hypothetical protein